MLAVLLLEGTVASLGYRDPVPMRSVVQESNLGFGGDENHRAEMGLFYSLTSAMNLTRLPLHPPLLH